MVTIIDIGDHIMIELKSQTDNTGNPELINAVVRLKFRMNFSGKKTLGLGGTRIDIVGLGAMEISKITQYINRHEHSKYSKFRLSWIIVAAVSLSACVKEPGTSALSNSDIKAKQSSHEERYVAGKCTSANRLSSSNRASETLNGKLITYSENEAKLDDATKGNIAASLQAKGKELTELDHLLKVECKTYSTCEFQASTTKQDCSTQKAKFMKADRNMLKFGKSLAKLKTG